MVNNMKKGCSEGMEWDWIWKSVLIIVGGTILLRVAGRKSISQMTLAQTIIMIGLGSLLIQPIAGENMWVTLGASAVLVLTLIAMEWGQMKSDRFETWITGQAIVVIDQGKLRVDNLKKMRLTVDQLEMRLRLNQVSKISDVQYATLEPNGQLGIMLKDEKSPATKQEIEALKQEIMELRKLVDIRLPYVRLLATGDKRPPVTTNEETVLDRSKLDDGNIFVEAITKSHLETPPKHLQ